MHTHLKFNSVLQNILTYLKTLMWDIANVFSWQYLICIGKSLNFIGLMEAWICDKVTFFQICSKLNKQQSFDQHPTT